VIDEVEDVLDHLGRGVRVESDGGGSSLCPDVTESTV